MTLVGQFWNIPTSVEHFRTEIPNNVKEDYDANELYLVKVTTPTTVHPRQFIGERFEQIWNHNYQSCIYVGNSQGGNLVDIPGPQDTVIEGVFSDYIIKDGLFGIQYKYNHFDQMFNGNL